MTTNSLRDLTRRAVREEVLSKAWALFAQQGYEATTIDQVAEAAGMSRRTFFRYFSGKDELILERLIEAGERVATTLAARPADEPAWPAMRAAFEELVRSQEQNATVARALGQMLRDEAGARASVEERRHRWLPLLAPLVETRLPPGPSAATRATAVVGAALACLDAAGATWLEDDSTPLGALLDAAMSALTPLDTREVTP